MSTQRGGNAPALRVNATLEEVVDEVKGEEQRSRLATTWRPIFTYQCILPHKCIPCPHHKRPTFLLIPPVEVPSGGRCASDSRCIRGRGRFPQHHLAAITTRGQLLAWGERGRGRGREVGVCVAMLDGGV